jgi:hypothetical protein
MIVCRLTSDGGWQACGAPGSAQVLTAGKRAAIIVQPASGGQLRQAFGTRQRRMSNSGQGNADGQLLQTVQ